MREAVEELFMTRPLMQRPVMDPTFLQHLQAGPPTRRQKWFRSIARSARWTWRILLSSPFPHRRNKLSFPNDGLSSRAMRAVAYRLVFAPAILALAAGTLVFTGTHPRAAAASGDPSSFGVYYDPIDFPSDDGVQLTGWLVPVVDARRVMLHRERLLRQVYPAVVLVHDFGQSPQQMLPLVAPLHEDGIVVLAIGLRGTGTAKTAAQTFGLSEAADVLAAVNILRRRPFVDPTRVAVIGIGTGANAAVLAAEKDSGIAALVLADPLPAAADVVAQRIGPSQAGLRWMQPLTKWTFELAYRHDIDEMSLDQHQTLLASRKVLRVEHATTDERLTTAPVETIRKFCRDTLRPWEGK
jgi:pimeloyl-ACP methyl ester carboxylesterase